MPSSLKVIFIFLVLASRAWAQAPASIEARLSSSMIVVGEKTLLDVEVRNAQVIDWPDSPNAAPLALGRQGKTHVNRNGRIHEVFQYTVSAFREGVFVIPPFLLKTRQGIVKSKPITLRVFPISDLTTKGISLKPAVVPYLSGIFVEKKSPYLGETQTVEAKLYVPHGLPHLLKLYDGQVIQMKKDGIAAWRFTADQRWTGALDYDGHNFAVYTYTSSINALREGDLTIGPGKAEPVFQMRTPSRGGFGNVTKAIPVEFPGAQLKVRPLPDNAPAGFQGAVGNFNLDVSTTSRDLKLGDTVTVEARVTGSGNIDQFPGPFLVDPEESWKQFEMIAKPFGSERRSSSGTVEFSQVVRPTKNVPALPSYRFVFFDPVLEKYRTLETPAIPLTITGEAVAPEAVNSGLPFLTPSGRALRKFEQRGTVPIWLWQILPAAILTILLLLALRDRLRRVKMTSLPSREFQGELEKLRAHSFDRIGFYREAAKFVTARRGRKGFEEIFEIRDDICFQPDAPLEPIPDAEKNRILTLLKSLSPVLVTGLFFILQFAPVQALDNDPAKAREEVLIEIETNPTPEHFYNLALCEKELGNPRQAALWAHRYAAQGGDATDFLKGLPGIHPVERRGTEWVSILPQSTYRQLCAAGAWALAILLVAFWYRNFRGRRFLILICGVILPLCLLVGAAGWYLYPNEVSFRPRHELSVVIGEEAPLQSQPYEGGKVLRDDVSGSLCKITAERSGWVHLELPGGITGWTKRDLVEAIQDPAHQ
jgi:hypothetical protein